jgi:alkylation response protein AidB-like acyl-CoA dehydrogenase
MDFAYTEEQEMLRKAAQEFGKKKCPKSFVRAMEKDERGFSPELWKEMAELGWMGCCFPEEYGGIGGSFIDLIVLLEEFGRALLPSPFLPTVVHCGFPILFAGTEEQKREFLPKIASGELIMTLAMIEGGGTYRASDITLGAVSEKDDYVTRGSKLFVVDAHVADWLLCVARSREAENKEDGVSLLLVDGKSPGIRRTPLKNMAWEKQFEVVFDGVRVPKKNLLGPLDRGWEIVKRMMEHAAVAQCSLMVGGAGQALEMSIEYAKTRVQFDRPIGSFQAIQHQCADMAMEVLISRNLTYQAAWKLSEGLPGSKEVAMAKAFVSEAYERILFLATKVHGAIGLTGEHDMSLYFRRGKAAQAAFGDSDFHKEQVAQALGL